MTKPKSAKPKAKPRAKAMTVAQRTKKIHDLELQVNRATALAMLARSNSNGFETYEGQRDLEKVLGWNKEITYKQFYKMYRRGGIAKTIINLPATSTWKGDITLKTPRDKEGNATTEGEAFEKKWLEIWKEFNIRDAFLRADKLCGVGQYSLIRLGFSNDDEADASEPLVGGNHELIYLSVFSQPNAQPKKWNTDTTSKEFGHVEQYDLRLVSAEAIATGSGAEFSFGEAQPVNADRCVHIAEGLEEDNVFGTPRLEGCWNNLTDLQKISGGSAEMYWRGAFPGFNFNLDPEADVSDEALARMETQIESMILGLGRYTQMEGVSMESTAPQVVDPKGQVEVQIEQVSGTTRIPQRKLLGSERGELASGQDESNWNSEVECRRENDCNRWIRILVERLMNAGVLQRVKDYVVEWPSLEAEKGLENSEIAFNISRAIGEYVKNGGDRVLPLEAFLEEVLNWDHEKAKEVAEEKDGEDDLDDDDLGVDAPNDERTLNELASLISRAMAARSSGTDNNDDDE